jgi:hypothetical protein
MTCQFNHVNRPRWVREWRVVCEECYLSSAGWTKERIDVRTYTYVQYSTGTVSLGWLRAKGVQSTVSDVTSTNGTINFKLTPMIGTRVANHTLSLNEADTVECRPVKHGEECCTDITSGTIFLFTLNWTSSLVIHACSRFSVGFVRLFPPTV